MKKLVSQLTADGYYAGTAQADQSPLEPGVWLLPGGCVDHPPPLVAGGKRARWDGAQFVLEDSPQKEADVEQTPAEPNLAPVVTMRQFRLMLLQAGLLPNVEEAIASIGDQAQRSAIQIEWEYATEVSRYHPWVLTLEGSTQLDDVDFDALFEQAALL